MRPMPTNDMFTHQESLALDYTEEYRKRFHDKPPLDSHIGKKKP
jgi:hypothetical protein